MTAAKEGTKKGCPAGALDSLKGCVEKEKSSPRDQAAEEKYLKTTGPARKKGNKAVRGFFMTQAGHSPDRCVCAAIRSIDSVSANAIVVKHMQYICLSLSLMSGTSHVGINCLSEALQMLTQ